MATSWYTILRIRLIWCLKAFFTGSHWLRTKKIEIVQNQNILYGIDTEAHLPADLCPRRRSGLWGRYFILRFEQPGKMAVVYKTSQKSGITWRSIFAMDQNIGLLQPPGFQPFVWCSSKNSLKIPFESRDAATGQTGKFFQAKTVPEVVQHEAFQV